MQRMGFDLLVHGREFVGGALSSGQAVRIGLQGLGFLSLTKDQDRLERVPKGFLEWVLSACDGEASTVGTYGGSHRFVEPGPTLGGGKTFTDRLS